MNQEGFLPDFQKLYYALGVLTIVAGAITAFLARRDKQQEERFDEKHALLKESVEKVSNTQKVLFEKLDKVDQDIQDHKVHDAESYVSFAALKEAMTPVNEMLRRIETDVRELRHRGGAA